MQSALVRIYQLIKERFAILKRLGFICLSSVFLSACASTYVEGFHVGFNRDEAIIVVKNTDIFKKCIPQNNVDLNSKYFIGVRCIFNCRVPDEFTITYAVWMDDEERRERFYGKIEDVYDDTTEVTVARYVDINGNVVSREVWEEQANIKIDKAINELPDSAWQTYTVDTKSSLEKYKGKTPDGKPMGIVIPIGWGIYNQSLFPSLKDRVLNLDIRIDKNGKVEVEENYRWENELPSNPYA